MYEKIKHFVDFHEVGHGSEVKRVQVAEWDPKDAESMAAAPGFKSGRKALWFQFVTMASDGWEPRETDRSPTYHMGGQVFPVSRLDERYLTDEGRSIFRSFRAENFIVFSTPPYHIWKDFHDGDVCLKGELGNV